MTEKRSGEALDTLLVTLLPVTYLVVSGAVLASQDVAVWQLWTSLAAWGLLVGVLHHSTGWARLVVFTSCVAAGLFLALPLCEHFYDLFYDSRTYHATGFLRLSEGWNPVWDWGCCPAEVGVPAPAHPLLAESYPKAAWLLAALLIEQTGSLQSSFLIHLVALAAACALCWRWLQLEWRRRALGLRILVCLSLALSPIALSQLFSHYVDGLVASVLLCWFLSSRLFLRTGRTHFLVQAVLLVPLALNLKFTMVAYLGVLGPALLWAAGRGNAKGSIGVRRLLPANGSPAKQWLWLSLAAGILGVLVFGWNPYVSNTLRQGNPFYPALGYRDTGSAVADAADRSFTERNILSKVVIANFSVSSQADPRKPRLAQPLRWDFPPGVDHRFSGFGPLFGAVLLLAIAVLLLESITGLLKKGKSFLSDHRPTAVLLAGLLLSVVITDAGWWARLAPQLWWGPVLVAVSVRRLWARRLGILVLALGLLNSGLVGWHTLGSQYRLSRGLAGQLRAPAAGFVIEADPGLFTSYSWHLVRDERPDLDELDTCPRGSEAREIELLPGVRVCR